MLFFLNIAASETGASVHKRVFVVKTVCAVVAPGVACVAVTVTTSPVDLCPRILAASITVARGCQVLSALTLTRS